MRRASSPRVRAPSAASMRSASSSNVRRPSPAAARKHIAGGIAFGVRGVDRAGTVVAVEHGRTVRAARGGACYMTARMAVNTDAIGKSYPPDASTRSGARRCASTRAPWGRPTRCTSTSRPRARPGYDDVVAPPMFAVVYAMPAVAQGMFDPEVGIDFSRLVHAGQEFEWGPLVVAGDEISTTVSRQGRLRAARQRLLRLRVGVRATSAARRSAPARGRTSCEGRDAARRRDRAAVGDARIATSRCATRARRATSTRSTSTRSSRSRSGCRGASCTACTRWRRSRGR